MGLGSGIRDPEKNLFWIPDPGGLKRHRIPDPELCILHEVSGATVPQASMSPLLLRAQTSAVWVPVPGGPAASWPASSWPCPTRWRRPRQSASIARQKRGDAAPISPTPPGVPASRPRWRQPFEESQCHEKEISEIDVDHYVPLRLDCLSLSTVFITKA